MRHNSRSLATSASGSRTSLAEALSRICSALRAPGITRLDVDEARGTITVQGDAARVDWLLGACHDPSRERPIVVIPLERLAAQEVAGRMLHRPSVRVTVDSPTNSLLLVSDEATDIEAARREIILADCQ